MKESEAKTKTCPLLFIGQAVFMSSLATAAAAGGEVDKAVKEVITAHTCIGSQCMMWEPGLVQETATTESEPSAEPKDPDPPEDDGWAVINKNRNIVPGGSAYDDNLFTIIIKWYRWVPDDTGDCGLKSQELQCGASY